MRKLLFISMLFLVLSFQVDIKKVDATKGFDKYTFGMSKNEAGCNTNNQDKDFPNSYNLYPRNMFVDKVPIEKITLVFDSEKLYKIYVYTGFKLNDLLNTKSLLNKKYGEPKFSETTVFDTYLSSYNWEGNEVSVSLHPGKKNYLGEYISSHYITYYYKGKKKVTSF